jgi:hypothetical protein
MGLLDKKKSLLNDEQSHWGDVANRLVDDGFNFGGSLLRGAVKGIGSIPVETHNLVSDITGFGPKIDTFSSKWIGDKLEPYLPDGNPKTQIAGEFINPFGAIKAASAAFPLMGLMFAGKGAKTADLFKLRKAEEMLKKGGSDRDAYAKTGWTHGFADKNPRFEIDDSGSSVKSAVYDAQVPNAGKFDKELGIFDGPLREFQGNLSEAIEHPELYKNYDIGNSPTTMYINRLSEGSYNPLTNRIKVGGFGDESKKSTALHEIQHAIQTKEGHGMGGSPTSSNQLSKDQRFESARQAYNNSEGLNGNISDKELLSELFGSKDGVPAKINSVAWEDLPVKDKVKWLKRGDESNYRKLAGESEARLTQARKDMTAAERAKSYPPDMFDVPVEDQIVRFDGGKQMSQKPTLKSIESANKNVQADVSEKGNILTLSKISVPKEFRKKGHADAYMNDLVKLADEEGKAIALTPSDSFGANKNKLSRWYKKHGFVPNKGRNKDFSTRESMIRPIKKVGGLLGDRPKTKYELAHEVAQRNATLPTDKGGLNLPLNNTAADRAKALKYDRDVYHGSNADIKEFDPDMSAQGGITWVAENPKMANDYAGASGGNLMPLKAKMDNPANWEQYDKLGLYEFPSKGLDGAWLPDNGEEASGFVLNPSQLRSKFAAFDPFKRDSSDILAGVGVGGAGFEGLLSNKDKKKKKKK